MFSFLGKEQAPIQLYGKLPLAKDYLRVGAGAGSGQMFRDWLDRAFSQAPNAKDALTLAWPAAFILGEAWGAPLIGAAWPSSDNGGLRPFPFVAFIERKKKSVLEDFEAGAPVSAAIWERMQQVYATRETQSDAQGFLNAMRGEQVDVAQLESPAAEPIEFAAWLEALWPGKGKDGLLETLCAIEALRKQAHRGPIRLPLVVNLPTRPQVHAWLKLLTEMNLVGRDALPTLFFPLPPKVEPPAAATPDASSDPFGSSSSDPFGSSSSDPFGSSSSDPFGSSSSDPFGSPSSDPFGSPSSDPFGSSSSDPFGSPSSDPFATPSDPFAAPTETPNPFAADSSAGETSDLGSSIPEVAMPTSAPVDPAFVTIFRTAPSPADAVWLRAPQPGRARAAGDLCPAEGRSAENLAPPPEQLPTLWESLRGAFVSLRGRIR